jgi:hypothetical protein
MTVDRAETARRVALCVLLVAALSAGAEGSSAHGYPSRPDGLLVASTLPAQQLRQGRTSPSDLVALWQSMLWADGYVSFSAVTCVYDRATAEATRVWQNNHNLSVDGIVGVASWGVAAQRIVPAGRWMVYLGERHGLPLRLDARGVYEVYDGGRFRPLRTDAVTLTHCR